MTFFARRCVLPLAAMAAFAPGVARGADAEPKNTNLIDKNQADKSKAATVAVDRSRPTDAQAAAATAAAGEILRRDVLATPFNVELTIEQVSNRLNAGEAISKAVRSAEPTGGVRWREDRACEVRLSLPGSAVADALDWAAGQPGRNPGMPPQVYKDGIRSLRRRTFSAVGLGPVVLPLDRFRPDPRSVAWREVRDEARVDALDAAKADAVAAGLNALRGVHVPGGRSTGGAMSDPDVHTPIRAFLETCRPADVQFGDDLQVRLTLAVPPDELWKVAHAALTAQKLGPPADDAAGWSKLQAEVTKAFARVEGKGSAATPVEVPRQPLAIIPRNPPRWASQQIDAVAKGEGTGLKGARAAEAAAMAEIRQKVDALPLADRLTLADAAKGDAEIARAVAEAVQRARITKVDYQPESATVTMSLDLEWVWRGLERR